MTREEAKEYAKSMTYGDAIDNLKRARSVPYRKATFIKIGELLDLLEQEPCVDVISRDAVDELSKELVHTTRDKADFLCNFWEGLQKLPPVTPPPKTGYWIYRGQDTYTCSECSDNYYGHFGTHYCSNCGAKMVESEDKK